MKSWLEKHSIEMYSIHNEGKSVVAERFIRTLKNKIYNYMTLKELRNCISRIICVQSLFCSTRIYTSLHFLLILFEKLVFFVFLFFFVFSTYRVEFDIIHKLYKTCIINV